MSPGTRERLRKVRQRLVELRERAAAINAGHVGTDEAFALYEVQTEQRKALEEAVGLVRVAVTEGA